VVTCAAPVLVLVAVPQPVEDWPVLETEYVHVYESDVVTLPEVELVFAGHAGSAPLSELVQAEVER
jgi:hypothetical protein